MRITPRLTGMTVGLAVGITAAVAIACGVAAYLYSVHHFQELLQMPAPRRSARAS
jgi:tRNA A37 threonylcarbamoyltransferase TsaD